MHRKHIRATVGTSDVDIPTGTFIANRFLFFNGIAIITVAALQGPVSSTDNAVTRWDGTTGTLVQNSVVLIDDAGAITGVTTLNTRDPARWVDGPAAGGSTDSAIARWDGTTGRLIQNSVVAISDTGNITGVTDINGLTPGDVVGPGSSTDNALVRWDGVSGKLIQNSVVTLSDVGQILGVTALNTRDIARWTDGPNIGGATDGAVALWDGTTGRLLKNSAVTINTGGDITTPGDMNPTTVAGIPKGVLVKSSGSTPHTLNTVTRWDSGSGHPLKDSTVTLSDSGNMTGLGTLNTRTIANWVDGPASATDNAIARFDATTGKLIQNSGVLISDAGNITGITGIDGVNPANFVRGPASAVNGNLAAFSGTDGKAIFDTGIANSVIGTHVAGPGSSTDNAVARWDTTTGRLIQNSVVAISDTGDITGVTAINSIAIANYAITSSGNSIGRVPVYNSGTSITQSQVVISTGGVVSAVSTLNGIDPATWVVGPSSATDGRVAVYDGATGKLLKNGTKLEADVVTGPASATDGLVAVFNGTTGKAVKVGTRQEASLVAGPAVATDNAIARFDATTGKLIQDSVVTIADGTGNISGAGTYNGITIHDQYFDARRNGGTGTTPKSTVYTATKAGQFNVLFFIWYNVADTGSNIIVTVSASANFNHAVVSCGAQGGQITTNGASGTLLTGTSGLPNTPPIPATGLIMVVMSQDVAVGTTMTVAISGSGVQHNVAEGSVVAFEIH